MDTDDLLVGCMVGSLMFAATFLVTSIVILVMFFVVVLR